MQVYKRRLVDQRISQNKVAKGRSFETFFIGESMTHPKSRLDACVFSNFTKEDWEKYAGKVLALNPVNDEILAFADTEEECGDFGDNFVEFFHVPAKGTLKPTQGE